MPRLIFIHGYVEDPTIFDQLAPLLPGTNKLFLNLQEELANWQPGKQPVNALTLAHYLADHHQIKSEDIVIGHSMGGWIAIHLKQLTGCVAIQISSFTDSQKVRMPFRQLWVLKTLTYLGVMQSRRLTNYLKTRYPRDESRALYTYLLDRMPSYSRRYIWQQFQILFTPVPPLTARPDLRIHARRDTIIKYPTEPYSEVPGDHFSLVCHAADVAASIRALVQQKAAV
jgi:pimeloyl-ACP methyl ester carboxylesterase